jgi:DNA-binding beta-propeller fold protein YncE
MSGMTSHSKQPPSGRRRPVAARGLAVAAALAAVLGACGGDNMFSGPNAKLAQTPPVVSAIEAPQAVGEGDSLKIIVRAFAPLGIAKIDIRFRGAVTTERSLIVDSRSDTASVATAIQVPAEVQDTTILVEATVTDKFERVSDVLVRTVRVLDTSAPSVTASVTPERASMGDTVRVRVIAVDAGGLQAIGFALVGANGDTIVRPPLASVSGSTRDTTFLVALPDHLLPSELRVIGIAVNAAQLRAVSAASQLVIVDLKPPTVRILTPREGESFPLTDSLLVRVHAADSGGVSEVRLRGVAIRRDSLQNTQVVTRYLEKVIPLPGPVGTAPRDTTIVRYLLPAPIDVSEAVYIVATAKDAAGNTAADTVRIIDGPRAQIMNPADGTTIGVNRTLLVNVTAIDRVAGLDSLKLVISGVRNEIIPMRNLGGRQSLDTTFIVNTGSTVGSMTLRPMVWNRAGAGGSGPSIQLTVSNIDVIDTEAPLVSRRVTTSERVELRDSIRVAVRATDGSGTGVRRMGAVVVAIPDTESLPRRIMVRTSSNFDPPLSGTPERVFSFALSEVYSELETTFPRKFTLEVHGFAVDVAGNCGASSQEQFARDVCEAFGSGFIAGGVAPAQVQVTATQGRSVSLPGGGRIADAVVDPQRSRVYLSNIENNRVDIFQLGADSFLVSNFQNRRGLVGAAPWGMVMSNLGDSLYVANSGGTNISVVPLGGPAELVEDVPRRIMTPNVVLFDVKLADANGFLRYTADVHDFSDRPQFIAQHATGTLVYSTLPTNAARNGTLRYIDQRAGLNGETYLLHRGAVRNVENSFAIANIDSLKIVRFVDAPDLVILFDRVPGTNELIVSDPMVINEALTWMSENGSDVEWYGGAWNVPAVALGDTTFVAASSDRSTIAFGEGAKAPFGRVILCCTVIPGPPLKLGLSNEIAVGDLVRNASERVFGLGLNANGTLGVARGSNAAYFFTPDLRLQGEFRSGMAGGAGGASLHPQHASALETGDRALAFVPTGNRTIRIIDSAHFFQRGEIAIRDNVVGPVRAVLPPSGDNAGRAPTDPNFIVVRLVAVTSDANVVVINVRRKDITN